MSASTKFIHPVALKALENTFAHANMRPVIVQTQGDAEQSAGTHNSAGKYLDAATGRWQSYSACIDISVRQSALRLTDRTKVAMNEARIKWFLQTASEFGLPGFYRTPSQGFDVAHLHLLCPMVPIKPAKEETQIIIWRQIADFLDDRNGLKGHAKETFWTATEENDAKIAKLFLKANPGARSMVPLRFR